MVEYTHSVSMLSGGPLTLGERVTSPTPELTPELNSKKSVDEWGTFQKAFMERQIIYAVGMWVSLPWGAWTGESGEEWV